MRVFRLFTAVAAVTTLLPMALADDLVNQKIHAGAAAKTFGVTGKGVVVAILDRGIDWQHPDFIKPDGTTRIKWLLDMSGQQGCGPDGTGMPAPVEYTEAQINTALAGGAPISSRDAVGHGTASTGLAAGNGRAFAFGKYSGLAPEADLIIVKLVSEGAPAHDSQPIETPFQGCIQQALAWLDRKVSALGEPVVALINSGTQWGPTDGTSAVSRQIDAVFGADRPGRVYVAAAGDEGRVPNHAGGNYDNTADTVVRFSKATTDTVYMSGWYSGTLPAQITLSFDDGTTVGPVPPSGSITQSGISIFQYAPGQEFYPWTSTSGDRAVWIRITGHSGGASVNIRGLQPGGGRFDLYGDVSGPNLTPIDSFLDHLVTGRMTDYASTRSAIVSGDYVVRTSWIDIAGQTESIMNEGLVDDLWIKSSGGPTRDGRLPGIDCVAPGQNSFAASAQNSYWHTLRSNLIQDGGGWYVRAGGTSGSAPITVGAVALMLQLKPGLTGGQIKQILRDTSVSDSFTGPIPSVNWGYGKLNLLQALTSITASLSVSSNLLMLNYTVGGAIPGPEAISVTNSGNGALSWSASSNVPWLVFSPAFGTTPSTLYVSLNPAGLSAGTLSGIVIVSSPGVTSQTINVTLTVTAKRGSPPAISEVDNAFSNIPNSSIQAGTWVAIKGTNLSNTPAPGRGWNANENFPTSMDGTSVTIDGKAAFMYYISPTQLNVQAPSDTATGPVSVVVTTNGVSSVAATATLQPYSPALLQWGGGQYQYAEITRYPDNTFVGNPSVIAGTVAAKGGDILTLWVTGLGPTNPALPAGQQPAVVSGSFPTVTTNPLVTVGGTNVTVLGAILRFAGLYQVNIQLPASLQTGNLPLKVTQGSYQSPDGILLAIE